MTTLLVACVVTVVFMFCQDVLGSSLVVAESRSLRFWPGLFDGLGDLVSRYGAVVAAVTAVHFGIWSWQMLALAVLTAITSFFTSNVAIDKASMLLPKSRLEQVGRRPHATGGLVAHPTPMHFGDPPELIIPLSSLQHQTTIKGEEPMSLLDTIETRFKTVARTAVDDVEEAAHSKIGQALVGVAKEILPLLPDGPTVELFVTKLQEAEAWAHRSLSAAPPAAPVNPGGLFTTTLDASAVDVAAWPVAPFKTADGRQLYTWAGQGAAPADGTTWVAYSGDVVAA